MKKKLLKTLIPLGIVTSLAPTMCLTSCSKKFDVRIDNTNYSGEDITLKSQFIRGGNLRFSFIVPSWQTIEPKIKKIEYHEKGDDETVWTKLENYYTDIAIDSESEWYMFIWYNELMTDFKNLKIDCFKFYFEDNTQML